MVPVLIFTHGTGHRPLAYLLLGAQRDTWCLPANLNQMTGRTKGTPHIHVALEIPVSSCFLESPALIIMQKRQV